MTIGHNNPPDAIDEATAPFSQAIEEAQNWLDGTVIDTESQMIAVDAIIKELRSAKAHIAKAKKSATAPLHDAWKNEIARWKPTEDDVDRRLKGLAAVVDQFKRDLAKQKEEAKKAAYEEARRKEQEAEEARRKASPADYEAQVAADRAAQEAMEAKKAASAANKDTVKGMRTVHHHEITDHRALLHWIAANDKPAMTAFIEDYARRNARSRPMDGVRTWTEKEAY